MSYGDKKHLGGVKLTAERGFSAGGKVVPLQTLGLKDQNVAKVRRGALRKEGTEEKPAPEFRPDRTQPELTTTL